MLGRYVIAIWTDGARSGCYLSCFRSNCWYLITRQTDRPDHEGRPNYRKQVRLGKVIENQTVKDGVLSRFTDISGRLAREVTSTAPAHIPRVRKNGLDGDLLPIAPYSR